MPTLRELYRQTQEPNEHHVSTIPSREFKYITPRFLDASGNRNMGVDASGGDIDFIIGPPANEIWFVEFVTLFIADPGDMSFNNFGSIAPLAVDNSFLFLENIDESEEIICSIRDNLDIEQCFFGSKPRSQSAGGTDNGFLDDPDIGSGQMGFQANVVLDGSTNDELIFRVRANLSTVLHLASTAHVKIPRIIQSQ